MMERKHGIEMEGGCIERWEEEKASLTSGQFFE